LAAQVSILGLLRTLERITRPPRMCHDWDVPLSADFDDEPAQAGPPELCDVLITPSAFEIAEWTADAARFIGGLSADVAAEVAASVALRVVDAIKQSEK
jgi:hypothetical protein